MNANQALWEKGDFSRIADSMRECGESLVAQFGISKGMKVLDLGCGDGTTALPEAKLGADVLGIDINQRILNAAGRRAKELGLANCRFQQGDASDLKGIEDRSFDRVVSIFGAMFAPNPHDVAKEMVRVTKPGGRIIMGNWIPGDPTWVAQILKTCSAYTPAPPAGFISPMMWGVESHVTDRFTAAGARKENISFLTDSYTFNYSAPPSQLVDAFRYYYAPTMTAYEAAEKNGRAEDLHKEMNALFARCNTSADKNRTCIAANFLRVTVTV